MTRKPLRFAAVLAAAPLLLASCSSGPAATFRASITNRAVINPATLAVTIQVTNTSKAAGTPQCTIQASDASGSYSGTDVATMRSQLAQGKTTTFVDDLTITSQGARFVTSVTVKCAGS